MKVTVVGSGHGGCALAAVLSMRGHEVSILKIGEVVHEEHFDTLLKTKTIRLSGIEGKGKFCLAEVSRDPSAVIPQAETIVIYYVSNYQADVANVLEKYLDSRQCVILGPGYLGSLIFETTLKRTGKKSIPLFAEFETLPYSSRIDDLGGVNISSKNVRHPFAAYPASRSHEVLERVGPLLGECIPRRHLLEVALHNPNLIIHTIGVLLNVSLVEDKNRKFAMYREGFSPSMWKVVEKLDNEKMNVLEKLGAPKISYFEEFKLRTFEDTSIDSYDAFMRYAEEAPGGPYAVDNRYVTEDVPMGLGLLHSLGGALGVGTPVCDSLINIASAVLDDHDFWAEARGIESLWKGSLPDLLKALVR